MKRTIVIFLVIISIFVTSCSPQVTVTSKVTVTSPPTETPIPMPTSYPQFSALQEQIAASGERFTLLSDGTVQDGGELIPGLQVDPKGVVTLTVDGEQVEIDPAIIKYDDEKGLSIDGFKDVNADGDWEPAQETIDIGGNLSVVLGEKVDGGTLIDSFVADPSLTPEQQADVLSQTNYTEILGIPAEDAVWMQNENKENILVWASDPTRIIGWWMRSKLTATTGMELNTPGLINPETNESIFFNPGMARIWDTNKVFSSQLEDMRKSLNQMFEDEVKDWMLERVLEISSTPARLVSNDGTRAVFGQFVTSPIDSRTGSGLLFIEDDAVDSNGNHIVKKFLVRDFDLIWR